MGQRIKILYTISNFNTAGSGKVVYDLVKRLDQSTFDIEIACKDDKGMFFNEVAALGCTIHLVDTTTSYKPYVSLLPRVWKIAKFYKTHQYDIIHSWQWSGDWTEALAARLAGCKWLYTKKAMGFKTIHWKIKSFLAHYIITVNEEMKQYFPHKKAQQLIPFGVDTGYFSSESFEKKEISKLNHFHIVIVANLVPVKGLEVLLQAINILQDKQIELTVVGKNDNDYGKEMQQLTKDLLLDSQVNFVGIAKDVRPFLYNSDLYVIPSFNKGEGMPLALVEAMSMGIPVLGSDITGINFVLKDYKELLFTAGDEAALARKIKWLKASSLAERQNLGNRLRDYCLKNFDMKRFINAHKSLYLSLTKK